MRQKEEGTNLRRVTNLTKEQLAVCKAKGAIIDEDPTTSASSYTVTPPPPEPRNDTQASSAPSSQDILSTPGTGGSSAAFSQQDSELWRKTPCDSTFGNSAKRSYQRWFSLIEVRTTISYEEMASCALPLYFVVVWLKFEVTNSVVRPGVEIDPNFDCKKHSPPISMRGWASFHLQNTSIKYLWQGYRSGGAIAYM